LSVREIRLFGDPVLKSRCSEIVDFAKAKPLIQDLIDTTSEPGRAGVAANQIGAELRAFAYNVNGEVGYLINPVIESLEGTPELIDEGCLSVPGLWQKVMRHPIATASGFLLDGSLIRIRGEGLLAQALQHEVDHLDGYLYLDRLSTEERKLAFRNLREQPWFN
jgi:peptide deformylase